MPKRHFRQIYNERLAKSPIPPKDEDLICRRVWNGLGLNKNQFFTVLRRSALDHDVEKGYWVLTKQLLKQLWALDIVTSKIALFLHGVESEESMLERASLVAQREKTTNTVAFFTRVKDSTLSLVYSTWPEESIGPIMEPPYTVIARIERPEETLLLAKQETSVFVNSITGVDRIDRMKAGLDVGD